MAVPVYRPYVNAHGLSQLIKKPDIPDMRLMVGSAEELEPLPLMIYADLGPRQAPAVMQTYDSLSIEDVQEKIGSTSLTIDDFPGNTLYLGDPIMSF